MIDMGMWLASKFKLMFSFLFVCMFYNLISIICNLFMKKSKFKNCSEHKTEKWVIPWLSIVLCDFWSTFVLLLSNFMLISKMNLWLIQTMTFKIVREGCCIRKIIVNLKYSSKPTDRLTLFKITLWGQEYLDIFITFWNWK